MDRSCLTCEPPRKDAEVVVKKQAAPKVDAAGRLLSIKPNSRSRAPDAKRRERLYADQMGMTIGVDDDDIHA